MIFIVLVRCMRGLLSLSPNLANSRYFTLKTFFVSFHPPANMTPQCEPVQTYLLL